MSKQENLLGLIEISKIEAQLMLESGYLYMEMGDFKKSEETFVGCVSLLPRSATPFIGLGNLYFTQSRTDEAIKAYGDALKIKPDFADAHAFLGEAHLFNGDSSQALNHLQKARELDKEEGPAHQLATDLVDLHKNGAFANLI